MSRIENPGKPTIRSANRVFLLAAAMLAAGYLPLAHAQYVGHIDTNKDNNAPTLRATAVLEYTGDFTRPIASRLIPVAVWDGENYQPGGLYLAQPVPLTVESGTQYVLQEAGNPKGLFDVKAASDVEGSWIAIGSYQKPAPPNYAKLKRSRTLPRIVVEDDKPHFAHVPSNDSNSGDTTNASQASAPPVDPERPTLHKRSDSGNSSSSAGSTSAAPSARETDPDRPRLHKPAESDNNNGAPVTATDAIDPNRPHLERGRPEEMESLDAPSKEVAKLAGTHPDLEQMAAVSDEYSRPAHSYAYSWVSPDDEKKAQAELETAAQQLLEKSVQNVTHSDTNTKHVTSTVTHTRIARRKVAAPSVALADEQFKAYELSYGGGATFVFSATTGQGDTARYITLVAQPDFNGTPLVLFKQITAENNLNVIPRMKLVDAVDTDDDNRAELIFALENETGRQYAIYRVANNTVEQVFVTGS